MCMINDILLKIYNIVWCMESGYIICYGCMYTTSQLSRCQLAPLPPLSPLTASPPRPSLAPSPSPHSPPCPCPGVRRPHSAGRSGRSRRPSAQRRRDRLHRRPLHLWRVAPQRGGDHGPGGLPGTGVTRNPAACPAPRPAHRHADIRK